uniref:Reverse transcriptase Ty1/copia-type domain-containing protein n=1 Tax=Peronospora matthiolae TaxID=2874970 RepID=A0AAV1THY5_9STRA
MDRSRSTKRALLPRDRNHQVFRLATGPTRCGDSLSLRSDEVEGVLRAGEGTVSSKLRVCKKDFDEFVCFIGFEVSAFDPCRCIKVVDGHCVLVLVQVDDVLLNGISLELIAHTKVDLKTRFEMTDRGKYTSVLDIELVDGLDGSVTMCQRRYFNDILKRFGMYECKATASPVDSGTRRVASSEAVKIDVPFREAVGA